MASEPTGPRYSLREQLREYVKIGEWPVPDRVVDDIADANGCLTREDAINQLDLFERLIGAIAVYLGRSPSTEDDWRMLWGRLDADLYLSPIDADQLHPLHLYVLLTHRSRWLELTQRERRGAAKWGEWFDAIYRADPLKDDDPESSRIFRQAYGLMLLREVRSPTSSFGQAAEQTTDEGEEEGEEEGDLPDLVTLNQVAALAHRSKRTLERCKTKGELPPPFVEGGGGCPDLYDYEKIRPWIGKKFNMKVPPRFPASRRP